MFEREDGTADADLRCVAVADVAVVALAVVPALAPLRPLALPVLLVAPGYALVAACYPGRAVPLDATVREGPDDPGLSPLGRLALSLAGSVAVVAAVGLPLALLGRFAALPVVGGVCALVAALLALAWYRRRRRTDAFDVDPAAALSSLRAWSHGTRTDAVLTAACVVALAATGGVVYADANATAAAPGSTSAGLLGPANASDTPPLTAGETTTYRVAVSNHGARPANATVVASLETYGPNATAGETLPEPRSRDVVGRSTRAVGADSTAVVSVPVRPPESAPNARLVLLVYRGAAPADPTVETADAELHRWTAVGDAGTDAGANERMGTSGNASVTEVAAVVAAPSGVAA
ncbi:putative membrane protein [Halarchaeum rubridurum]|uniref:Putative membrane protein n=1 Tax=Halarchaeum rubridurum TaxID=489911 RepID=A0A830FYZ3_9EURY|nr:DUF1616 domain-containing protein [Halarchaeum rubridurum]MBP1953456.1 putative membrane protein [Halarchaeum rubridurum]GGM65132.1 hypothetical protein GCM10009017_14020 [Halarchaeum rubridurum]